MDSRIEERAVWFRPRTVLVVLGIILATLVMIEIVQVARGVLVWILIAVFLALALNPAVDWLLARGVPRRGLAVVITYAGALLGIAALGALFVPILVDQVNNFVQALPGYVEQVTQGRGRLGFLEREYQITERVREAIGEGGAGSLLGVSGTALAVTKGVVTAVIAIVTIAFLTLFMLLEGPRWVPRMIELFPARMRPEARSIADDIYHLIGRYVTGNLLISLIAGTVTTIVLLALGVPYALALGLLVAILDLIPLAGATIAAVIVTTIAIVGDSVQSGIIVGIFFLIYQQLENNVLQPFVYKRTVSLAPLLVIIAVLIGATLLGVLGALLAIPVAAAVQILVKDFWYFRKHPGAPRGADHTDPPGEAAELAAGETEPTPESAPVLAPGERPLVPAEPEPAARSGERA